jgi:hypothetical protein
MCHAKRPSGLGVHTTIFLIAFAAGCEKRRETVESTFGHNESDYVLTIVVDLSGSFINKMAEGGKAYDFTLRVVDRYFRDRIGTNDRIVLAQISGAERALLWEGTPVDLRHEFPNAAAFRSFLVEHATQSGSLVHAAMTSALQHAMTDTRVAKGQAKSALFVLSDMMDNGPVSEESERILMQELSDYGRCGGVVGLYYVDHPLVAVWKRRLQNAGIKDFCVESEIVAKPALPNFE